ncbi:MAG: FAD-dependent protein, partial [Planctomycetota bacterium]
ASYNLQSRGEIPAHSFCMCPGGRIVASVSEPGGLCTNGMSNSRHSSRWANAALVTTLDPAAVADLGFAGPTAGV